jgi:hypothetical protein
MMTRKLFTLLVSALLFSSCASAPIRYDQRLAYLEERRAFLQRQGWTEALSPEEFARGQKAYARAIDLIRQKAADPDIVNALTSAEIHFILAENRARKFREDQPAVAASRLRKHEAAMSSNLPVQETTRKQ